MTELISDLITRFILFIFLVLFAIYGVYWGAPKVGEVLREKMQIAVDVK